MFYEATKREILFSVIIVCVMLILGIVISGSINDKLLDDISDYTSALRIDNDADTFKYAMETNIGNALVHGDLKAIDPVVFEETGEKYSRILKITEEYTRHTRTVSNGKTTSTQVYYSWDKIDEEETHCTTISFLDEQFPYGTIPLSSKKYLDTIRDKKDSDIRYVYYGYPAETSGTIFAVLKNHTISDASFFDGNNINEVLENQQSQKTLKIVLFWVGWLVLTGGLVYGFYLLDNNWLEDKISNKTHFYN